MVYDQTLPNSTASSSVWFSDTSGVAKTSFRRGSRIFLHVAYIVKACEDEISNSGKEFCFKQVFVLAGLIVRYSFR